MAGQLVAGEALTADQAKGLVLALSSSIFIGSSFIVKKKGLRLASASGLRAGTAALERAQGTGPECWQLSAACLTVGGGSGHRQRRLCVPSRAAMVGGHDRYDRWRDRQLCGLCLCACHSGHPAGSAEHHHQVCTGVHLLATSPAWCSCELSQPPQDSMSREGFCSLMDWPMCAVRSWHM